jgi:ABC-type lipoprotein release transport system permease subunit
LQGCQPLCSPAALQLRGKILEFCQFGKDLSANVDQLIQPLPQVLHVGCVDFAALIGTFGGFLPAKRAMNIKPIEAIREE